MPYCTYCKCTSGKSIAKDQRISRLCSDYTGLYKNPPMERKAGRWQQKQQVVHSVFVVSSINRSSVSTEQLHTYMYQGSLLCSCFGMAIASLVPRIGNSWSIKLHFSDSELNHACHQWYHEAVVDDCVDTILSSMDVQKLTQRAAL